MSLSWELLADPFERLKYLGKVLIELADFFNTEVEGGNPS